MAWKIKSSRPTVRAPEEVRRLVETSYETRGVRFRLSEEGPGHVLDVTPDDDFGDHPPTAVPVDLVPHEADYSDEDAWFDARAEAFYKHGDEGLLALLRQLSPYLESPLVILALDDDAEGCSAEVWTVHPGAQEALHLQVSD
jgi:hypothetical protein